jgi:hypothetical protein
MRGDIENRIKELKDGLDVNTGVKRNHDSGGKGYHLMSHGRFWCWHD